MTTYAYADAGSAAIYAKDAAGADVVVGAAVCLTAGLSDFLLLAEPLLQAGPRGISLTPFPPGQVSRLGVVDIAPVAPWPVRISSERSARNTAARISSGAVCGAAR